MAHNHLNLDQMSFKFSIIYVALIDRVLWCANKDRKTVNGANTAQTEHLLTLEFSFGPVDPTFSNERTHSFCEIVDPGLDPVVRCHDRLVPNLNLQMM